MRVDPILLVEDSEDERLLARRALKRSIGDYPIIAVANGQEAIDHLFSPNPAQCLTPKVVILDLKMPKMGGLEVLKAIRSNPRTSALPVVILTSSKEHRDLVDCYQSGANSYVQKPVDSTEYSETIAVIGRYWATINERAQIQE